MPIRVPMMQMIMMCQPIFESSSRLLVFAAARLHLSLEFYEVRGFPTPAGGWTSASMLSWWSGHHEAYPPDPPVCRPPHSPSESICLIGYGSRASYQIRLHPGRNSLRSALIGKCTQRNMASFCVKSFVIHGELRNNRASWTSDVRGNALDENL